MRIESIPFSGFVHPPELDDLEAKRKSKNYTNEKFANKSEEEMISVNSVNPLYNSKGQIIDSYRMGKHLDTFA